MSKAVFIPPTTTFTPGQRVYFKSLYGDEDVPGKWVFVRLADGQHTTETWCVVRQRAPLIYPIEEGLVAHGRLETEPWEQRRVQIRRASTHKKPQGASRS